MTTYTLNSVIETLAPVIAEKNDYRAVIEYTNGDTVLLDFSNCGTPFTNDIVMLWSYQRDIIVDGHYNGTDEVDSGICTLYTEAFTLVLELLSKPDYEVKRFYAETF